MKIRTGFVSNSSTSSFTLDLKKPIDEYTLEEFREFIKGKDMVAELYKELKKQGEPDYDNSYILSFDDGFDELETYLNDNEDDFKKRGIMTESWSIY